MDETKPAKTREVNRKNGKPKKAAKISVNALFADYDGTLSPINVSRSESAVPPKTLVGGRQKTKLKQAQKLPR